MEAVRLGGSGSCAIARIVRVFAALFAALAATGGLCTAQQLDVRLRDPVLKLGDRTELQIQVTDERPDSIEVPQVEGLRFSEVVGPRFHSNTVISGGRVSRETLYEYMVTVAVDDEGAYTIPPLTVVVNGSRLVGPELLLEVVRDDRGELLGWLDIHVPFDRVVVGQSFPIDIDFGCRADVADRVGNWDLTLPWLGDLGRDAVDVLVPSRREGTPGQVSINRQTTVACSAPTLRREGSETYRVMRLRLLASPLRSGTIDLSGSALRFITGRWSETNIFGREFSATDKFFKSLGERSFEIRPLPEEGRPLGFTGAVGDLSGLAQVDVTEMFAGDSFKLTVDYTGAGNLSDFGAPNLELNDEFTRDFAIYGRKEERNSERRRIVYDLAPLSAAVQRVPTVQLAYFDPRTWEYRTLATDPIEIAVRPRATAAPPTEAVVSAPIAPVLARDIEDIATGALGVAGREGRAPSDAMIASMFGAVVVAWGALRLATRREGAISGPGSERRGALRRLDRELTRADTPEKELRAWTSFLAARTGVPAESWVGRNVRGDVRAGRIDLGEVATDLVARTTERLEAAAYGDESHVGRSDVLLVARDLLEEGL